MALSPTFAEVLRKVLASDRLDLHTAIPGKVVSYDSATQTADVQPVAKTTVPTGEGAVEFEEPPIIPNVPVGWIRGGGASLQLALAPGDHVLLVFSEADIGTWRSSGQVPSQPADLARHDWSYPYALPCAAPSANTLRDVSGPHMEVPSGQVMTVGGDPSGQNFVALANLVTTELNRIKTDLTTLKAATSVGIGSTVAADPGTNAAAVGAFNTATTSVPSSPGSVAATKLQTE